MRGLPATATRGWRFSRRSEIKPQVFTNGPAELQAAARRGAVYMHELYVATNPEVTGRVTMPALWDSCTGRVVCNESTDIVRILHQKLGVLGEGGGKGVDLYPPDLAAEVERLRAVVYGFNAGVYKCGFASSREGYERGLGETFAALDACEALLAGRPFLAGDRLTEADVCAFPTLIRFDVAYYTAFRCNRRRLRDYPNLSRYLERLYRMRAFRETVCFRTYLCAALIEARWRGRLVGNLARAAEAACDIALGAAQPGAALWRRALARAASLPARTLALVFR